jgi:NhaP-type Na+/H+ or K+/H+ antiporter
MLFSGFLLTRVTKKLRLPNVTGYILAGVLIGPSVFNIIPKQMISNMGFISDIALTFIAFSVGRFFKQEKLKKTGPEVLVITLFESLFAGIVVTIVMFFVFRLSFAFSLLLGAIATATAPASTIVTIRQYGARGKFVNMEGYNKSSVLKHPKIQLKEQKDETV